MLVQEAITRGLVNVGRRTSFERLAHLCCEIFIRPRSLSLVHVNRMLMHLDGDSLIFGDERHTSGAAIVRFAEFFAMIRVEVSPGMSADGDEHFA